VKCPKCGMIIETFEVNVIVDQPTSADVMLYPCGHIIGVEQTRWWEQLWPEILAQLTEAHELRADAPRLR